MSQPPSFQPDPSRRRPRLSEVANAGVQNEEAADHPRKAATESAQHSAAQHSTPAEPSRVQEEAIPPSFAPRARRSQPPAYAPSAPARESVGATSRPPVQASTQRPHFQPVQSQPSARQAAGVGPARPRQRKKRRWPLVVVACVLLMLAWPVFLMIDANSHLKKIDALSGATNTSGTTYLLAGSDSRADGSVPDDTEGQRADSIMLVHVAPNGQTSNISLPRDTYVEIPGYGWDKLNASYAYGGPALLVKTVEKLTGLTIDHYAEIGMGGVSKIVDAVDGVNLCFDLSVEDERSELNWEAGCHDADGKTALAFARMRYSDPRGDIGRAERQRQVVSKTVSKAMKPATLLNPMSALRVERAGASAFTVDQDSSVIDVARLVLAFREAQNSGMTGVPPIESLGYATSAGSAVLLEDTTAPDFFAKLRAGTLTKDDLASQSS